MTPPEFDGSPHVSQRAEVGEFLARRPRPSAGMAAPAPVALTRPERQAMLQRVLLSLDALSPLLDAEMSATDRAAVARAYEALDVLWSRREQERSGG